MIVMEFDMKYPPKCQTINMKADQGLWFDVEIERITTLPGVVSNDDRLWFDVEIERITTILWLL